MTDQPIRQYPDERREQAEADMLVVEPYRNDQNQPCWAFRCWGTDTCDGWLGLGHHTQTSALSEQERHVAEAHGELTDEDARNRASDAYQQAVQRIESAGSKAGHDGDVQKAGE